MRDSAYLAEMCGAHRLIPDRGRFAVLRNPTGNYLAGHADTLEKKKIELEGQGWVTIERAVEQQIVPADWHAPTFDFADYEFLENRRIPLPPEHYEVWRPVQARSVFRRILRRLFGPRQP